MAVRICMRPALALVVLLTACGDSNSWPAQAPSLEGLEPLQACDAVAPRALPCTDEVVVVELQELFQITYAEAVKMAGDDKTTYKVAKEIHRGQCLADGRYAPAVAACWTTQGCKPFAECVIEARENLPKPPRSRQSE